MDYSINKETINIDVYSELTDLEFNLNVVVSEYEDGTYEITDVADADYPEELTYNEMWDALENYECYNYDEIENKMFNRKMWHEADNGDLAFEQRITNVKGWEY